MSGAAAIRLYDWGTLPSDWKLGRLGDACAVRRGASPRPAGDPRFFGGSIPWFKIGDATRAPGRYISETETFVNDAGAAASVRIPAGSLIVANSGVSLGFPVITAVEGCIHDGWLLLTDLNGVDQDFLYYFFAFLTTRLREFGSGTTQPNLNTSIARLLEMPMPPLPEQQAIASVLRQLDEKIELNRKTDQTLQSLARTLFKAWFTEFDPVVAKRNGRQPYGMDVATAAMFSAHFRNSELGPIPSEWRVQRLGELIDLSRDVLSPGEFPSETFAHYSIPAFDEGRTAKVEVGGQIQSNKYLVPDGAVLISKLNPVFPRIWWPDEGVGMRRICSTEFLVARPRSPVTQEYLFALASSDEFSIELTSLVTGTSNSHQRVKPDDFLAIRITVPSEVLIAKYSEIVRPWHSLARRYAAELASLEVLRESLLPQLLSGEVRMNDGQYGAAGAA